jgi:hypothetical protein
LKGGGSNNWASWGVCFIGVIVLGVAHFSKTSSCESSISAFSSGMRNDLFKNSFSRKNMSGLVEKKIFPLAFLVENRKIARVQFYTNLSQGNHRYP